MEKKDLKRFDLMVERYLSQRMTEEEKLEFNNILKSYDELKQRAATIALVIKAMRDVGAERDMKIIAQIKKMTKKEFEVVAIGSPIMKRKYIEGDCCYDEKLGRGARKKDTRPNKKDSGG